MAVSAYKAGQLKKNPLRGTGLGVSKSRAGERERFKALHKEAKGIAGQGQAGMERRLKERYAKWGTAQQKAIGQETTKHRALETEAAGLRNLGYEDFLQAAHRDPKKWEARIQKKQRKAGLKSDWETAQGYYEAKLADVQSPQFQAKYGSFMPKEFQDQYQQGLIPGSPIGPMKTPGLGKVRGKILGKVFGKSKKQKRAERYQGHMRDLYRRQIGVGSAQKAYESAPQAKLYQAAGADRLGALGSHFAGTYGTAQTAAQSYEDAIRRTTGAIEQEALPLRGSIQRRREEMEDRMNAYNQFLGAF